MKTAILLIIAASLTGCVRVSYESFDKDGKPSVRAKYSSPAFGSKGIASADFEKGVVTGVRSEQSSMAEMAGILYQAGLAAGAKGVAP